MPGTRSVPRGASNEYAHAHLHRHDDGTEHVHWHRHDPPDWHPAGDAVAALHWHPHDVTGRAALLLILGSSPMVEGIPAFFAASTYGAALLGAMAGVFAASTIVTYAATCALGIAGLAKAEFGALERYGEVLSGGFVALVGAYALLTA